MRRVVQIGEGKIFGSRGFVFDAVVAFGERLRSRSVTAREVDGLGFATHGWRLAKIAAEKGAEEKGGCVKGAAEKGAA